jgi:thioredoxin 1
MLDTYESCVYEIQTIAQWNNIIKTAADAIIIIDFYAVWCGPCKAVKPKYEMLAETYKDMNNILFLSVDIEKVPQLSDKFEITSMPTFLVVHKDQITKRISGGNIKEIDFAIKLILDS